MSGGAPEPAAQSPVTPALSAGDRGVARVAGGAGHLVDRALALDAIPLPNRLNPITGFLFGFAAPFRCLGALLRNPGWWRLMVAPILLNIAVFAITAIFAVFLVDDIVGLIWSRPAGGFFLFLWTLIVIIAGFVSIGAVLVITFMMAEGIGGPFLARLSLEIERGYRPGLEDPPFSMADYLKELLKHILPGGKGRMWTVLTASATAWLILLFLPGIGTPFAAAIQISVLTVCIGRESMEESIKRRELKKQDMRDLSRGEIPISAGLGAAVTVLLLIPVVNLMALALSTMGGTLVYAALEAGGRAPEGVLAKPEPDATSRRADNG